MLSLDRRGPGQAASHGQHARNSDDQACMDAFAALLRSDATGAARFLSRLAKGTLGSGCCRRQGHWPRPLT